MFRVFLFIFLLFAFQAISQTKQKVTSNTPYLVVLSMDAFRWDYPEKYNTPHLDSLALIGVKAESLKPCFPSKTFPNHYSMVTGLHPQNHGIVQNTFTDPLLGDYSLGNRKAVENAEFYEGEPIWVTAEKQDVRSACLFWPGSEAPIKGTYPSIWKKYDVKESFEARVDSVIAWLQKPTLKRPHIILWYMHEPDGVGHNFGPDSKQTKAMIEHLDSLVGSFCKKINELPIADSINLVFTADHGMGAISPQKSITLNKYVKKNWVSNVKGTNPVYLLQPASEIFADSIQMVLSKLKHLKCWEKESLPEHLNYGNNSRIFDLVVAADPEWSIYWDKLDYGTGGAHGYDPEWKAMHAIFYGVGPAFKKAYTQPTFQNIDLYSLFAKIMNLQAAKTDGSLEEVEGMLKKGGE